MKKLLVSTALVIAGLFGSAIAASAHANEVSSYINCDTSTGTYLITWQIWNNWPLSEVAAVTVPDPTLYPINPTSVTIGPSPSTSNESSGAVVERFPGDSVGTFSLTAVGTWSDNYTSSATGYVILPGTCAVVTPPTTVPVVPTTVPPAVVTPTTIAPAPTTVAPPAVSTAPAVASTPAVTTPPALDVAPIATAVSPVHHHKVKKASVAAVVKKAIPQATAVHTGEPFAGTTWLDELVAGFALLLVSLGLVMRRRARI